MELKGGRYFFFMFCINGVFLRKFVGFGCFKLKENEFVLDELEEFSGFDVIYVIVVSLF